MSDEITDEEIAEHYTAMGHSVDLLNAGKPEGMEADEWAFRVTQNVEHLKLMRAKEYWTSQDMSAVDKAIAANT